MSETKHPTSNPTPPIEDDADNTEIEINESDIRVDVFRELAPGGGKVITVDSRVRITHLPTGIVGSSQKRSNFSQMREEAMKILKARLRELG